MNPFQGLAPREAVQSKPKREKKRRRFPAVTNPWGLTGAEWAILERLTTGRQQGEFAMEMFLSPKTISTHVARARQKMDAISAMHAVLIFDRFRRPMAGSTE